MTYPQYRPDSEHQPLSDEELQALDEQLAELPGDAVMNIEALDGYLAALLLSPIHLPSLQGQDWLPLVWGAEPGEPEEEAPFASGKQRKKLVLAVLRHLQSIEMAWRHGPKAWEPIFSVAEEGEEEYADAEDWAAGFLTGVALAPEAWEPLFEHPTTVELLTPIAALGSPDGHLASAGLKERDAASRAIPEAALALWALKNQE